MKEPGFKAVSDLIRSYCIKTSDNQVATLLGYVVHDQDERKADAENKRMCAMGDQGLVRYNGTVMPVGKADG